MKKTMVLHPLFLSVYPVLFLYAHNIDITPVDDVFTSIIFITGFTVLSFLGMRLVLKSKEKAGLIVSLFLLLFFTYGHFYDVLQGFSIGGFEMGRHRYLLLAYGIIFISGVYFTITTRRDLSHFTEIVNKIAMVLVVISLINVGIYTLNTNFLNKDNKSTRNEKVSVVNLGNSTTNPDIYYIILDGYGSANTLKEMYQYDNQEFIDYLTSKGFYVAPNSRSNYAATFLSLASSLNMEYLNEPISRMDPAKVQTWDRSVPYRMIRQNKVTHFLRSKGYKVIHFESGWTATASNKFADLSIQCGRWNEFQLVLLETTLLRPFDKSLVGDTMRARVLCAFSTLPEVKRKIEGPRLVFVHISCPHPPFIFGPNGEPVSETEVKTQEVGPTALWKNKHGYLNQLKFVNKKVKVLVNTLLSGTDPEPIIIMQGDHGPAATGDRLGPPTESLIKERMRIFNAYYLPGHGQEILYDSITPVNTFRLIFNHYFNASYDLLEDRSYYSRFDRPYEFIDVTDALITK